MPSIRCKNGNPHTHESVDESRQCWNTSLLARTQAVKLQPQARQSSGEKILMFVGMLDMVPEGYYAVQPDTETPLTFVRVSRPTREGRYRGATKIQRVSGPDLDLQAVVWQGPGDRRVTVYDSRIEDSVLLLVCDYKGAAFRYATEIGKCARCNTRLTDPESRRYGIGPECVKHWPWMIDAVLEREALGNKP